MVELDTLVVFDIFVRLVLLDDVYEVDVALDPERVDEDETIFEALLDDRGEVDESLC